MDTVLPALLASTILLLASLMVGRSGLSSFEVLSEAWQDAERLTAERTQSDISITSISVSGDNVDVAVRNDGETPLVDFSRMDVVVQYQAGAASVITWLPYDISVPQPNNTWRVTSITNDVVDPGVVNAGESANLRLRLDPPVGTGTSNWLQITTELGVSASMFFTN